jgi:hypothetical protein
MNKLSKIAITAITAAAAAILCAGTVFAQDAPDASGDDVYDFVGGGRAKKMVEEADPETVSEAKETAKSEHVPINEVVYIRTVKDDTSSAPDTAKAKAEKNSNAFGGRLGFGNPIMNIGGNLKIGVGGADRIEAGINISFAGVGRDGYSTWGLEAVGFYEWRFSISDDGVLGWYGGPGLAFGYYGSSKNIEYDTTAAGVRIDPYIKRHSDWNIGVGGQVGFDVNFSFIDPDHTLYSTFKDAAFSIDIRPMLYLPLIEKYQIMSITMGLSFRYAF